MPTLENTKIKGLVRSVWLIWDQKVIPGLRKVKNPIFGHFWLFFDHFRVFWLVSKAQKLAKNTPKTSGKSPPSIELPEITKKSQKIAENRWTSKFLTILVIFRPFRGFWLISKAQKLAKKITPVVLGVSLADFVHHHNLRNALKSSKKVKNWPENLQKCSKNRDFYQFSAISCGFLVIPWSREHFQLFLG